MHSEIDVLEQQLPPRERLWLRAARYAGWTLVGIYFLAALGVLGLRFLVLPNVSRYTETIAAAASRALGEKVEIGAVDAEWFGLHPRLELTQVRVIDREGREALRLPYVGVTVAWRSIAYGRPILRSLAVEGANLQVRRDPSGRVFVGGLEARAGASGEAGLAEAVLDMRELIVLDARIEWQDDFRGAPPLRLSDVELVLQNDGSRHRFALSAEPPRDHASAIDIRGELVGASLDRIEAWDGRIYAAFDFIDLAVWNAWIDLPLDIGEGRGALRVWATMRDWLPQEVVADVGLADVSARLGQDLPPLDLKWVEGRVGGRSVMQGFEFLGLGQARAVAYEAFATRVGLETTAGARFEPSTFEARWEPARDGAAARGTFTASSVDLEPLAKIGEALPLPHPVRRTLADMAPAGRLEDVRVGWIGAVEEPQSFAARSRFAGLAVKPYGKLPGFANLAGSLDLTEKGGTVSIDAANAVLDFPGALIHPRHELDTLAAKVGWAVAPGRVDVRVDSLALANREVAGSLSGSLQVVDGRLAYVDLTGRVPRVEGAAVHRFIPLKGPNTAAWLKRGLVAAQGSDGRFRIRGDPRDYPFDDPKTGVLELAVKIADGTLDYAPGWPRISGIAGELSWTGRRLEVRASRAATLGVRIPKAVAVIPDITADHEQLQVEGVAEGQTEDFLRFVLASPINRFTDGHFEDWSASGPGRLTLSIDMPLTNVDATRLAGTYEILGNAITPGLAEGALTQVSGRVAFDDSSVTAKGITGLWHGGAVTFDVATRAGGTVVSGKGLVNVPVVLAHFGVPLAQRFSGASTFTFSADTRGARPGVVIESTLQEIAVDLPPPFAKPAGEAWPLRIERTAGAAGAQTLDVSLARVLNARAALRTEGGRLAVERAAIGIGGAGVALPERPGVFVSASVPSLDLDRFLALQGEPAAAGPSFSIAALSLRTPELVVGGKLFHDVQARAVQSQPARWQVAVNAREVAGDVAYSSDGQGAVVARLKHLVHPEPSPAAAGAPADRTLESLPAVELAADRYLFDGRDLGRLEVSAVNERRGWRVDKLSLASSDCTFGAKGLWQPGGGGARPHTAFSFGIEAADAGKCLARLGYPEVVRGGASKLEGEAQWRGPVYALDFPTLDGRLSLDVQKGQFVKVDPGIGKLLGVLSLQSLPRRITLDFRDVFSEGFAFDSIRGNATMKAGVIRTDNLAMVGPAATVSMRGEADVARETQDLTVRVVPEIGDSVAAAAGVALLNPIIGAGALLAQRILKDPIGQMLAFEYRITGGWEDPKVERLAAPVAATEGAPGQGTAQP